jgi:hypothetical protein
MSVLLGLGKGGKSGSISEKKVKRLYKSINITGKGF